MLFHTSQRKFHPPDLHIDNIKINFVKEFNFLGILLDEILKFKSHVRFLSNKISKTIGILNKLKHSLPSSALLNIYNALILSYLNYGTLIWGWQSHNLFKLQKKALRTITNSHYNAHTDILFKQLSTLKMADICALHDYKFCYKLLSKQCPLYFASLLNELSINIHDYATRQANDIRLPAVRHEFARNGIRYRIPLIINNMPENFKNKIFTHSFFGYKYYIKNQIITTYNTICTVPNCFTCNRPNNINE
jgi:hypothetical protein